MNVSPFLVFVSFYFPNEKPSPYHSPPSVVPIGTCFVSEGRAPQFGWETRRPILYSPLTTSSCLAAGPVARSRQGNQIASGSTIGGVLLFFCVFALNDLN